MTDLLDVHDLDTLLLRLEEGIRPKYLFFWGHRARKDGLIGPQCLSQWWPAPFDVDGERYRTAEHFMMAKKARLFGDEEAYSEIMQVEHPGTAKKLGRRVKSFDEEVWRERRFDIVVQGNKAKFSQNERLKAFLLNTGSRVLVEASPVDRIWGIGLTQDDPCANEPQKWQGLNLLGFALMKVRAILREAEEGG